MKDKILIIGSEGFLGVHFSKYIMSHYKNEHIIYRADFKATESPNSYQLDVSNKNSLKELLNTIKPDYIINLAGKIGNQNLSSLISANVTISNNIIESIIEINIPIKKIILIGSAAEYGNNKDLPLKEDAQPMYLNNYGFSKHTQTIMVHHYLKMNKLPIAIARPFNIIGSGISPDLAIGAFIKKIKGTKDGGSISVGNLQSYRDYLDVNDVCDALYKIMTKGEIGKEYNICNNKTSQMKDILQRLIDISGKKINVKSTAPKSTDADESYGDNTRLKSELKWTASISLYESLYKAYHESN